jgi:tetratricopeptide (TPR) repeat protein
LQLGVLEAACENWDAAELCFDTVLKFDQRNTRVLQAYAIMETKRPSGDSRKAIGLFERAIQTNPRDAGVYQPYALYVAELGDIKMARSLLHKGTQVNKRHAAVWQAWGVLETRYGDADTARKIFQEGIWACGQLSGSQSGGYHCDRLWQAWGVLESNEKDYAAARRCFNRALDANNRNVPAFTAWALMEEQLGNVKDARMIFERGLRKFSTGSEEKKALYRSYELMEQRLGDTTAAQNIYQRSVRESFIEKDEVDILKTNVILDTRRAIDESYSSDTTSVQPQTTIDKKKTKEFEVIRWENTGGEVWLNDRAIEAKVSITNKKKSSRDGRNKDTISNK